MASKYYEVYVNISKAIDYFVTISLKVLIKK